MGDRQLTAKRRPRKKRRTREHVIADLSVNHVERCVLRCGFAAERVEKDYGLDLLMFTYAENGEIENGHVEMQLKATDSLKLLKDGRTIALEISPKDVFYWEGEPWPVILIVYDASSDRAYWLYVQRDMSRAVSRRVSGESATVHIPTANGLDCGAIQLFREFRNRILEQIRQGGLSHDGY